ncbi:MAG: cyclic nucleotide-binding/CBS domain-containing protein [Desulfobacter sp.]|nr:MAG: cyclic nucleotide-binding/CBS domain-containing protein [Desulfobacter sp.]
MEIELFEIRNHIISHPPFRHLPKEAVDELVAHVQVAYFKSNAMILEKGQAAEYLHFIRKGAVEIFRSSGELLTRMGEGECFGQFALMRKKKVRYPAKAIEDTLIYLIPDDRFQILYDRFDKFADFMEEDNSIRLQHALEQGPQRWNGNEIQTTSPSGHQGNPLLFSKLSTLLHSKIITASPAVTIQEAARIMTRNRVSSLVLLAETGSGPPIAGLITDRDLRKRVIARGMALSAPVSDIMSRNIVTHQAGDFAFEAMLTMMRHNLHHLPILDNDTPLGVVTVSDLIQYASHGSIFIVGDIFRKKTVDELADLAPDIRRLFVQLVNEGANAHTIGAALSRIGVSLSQRLLQLGEKELGPPPVPYCLLALGAMARDELTLLTDQDNAFVLDDAFHPESQDAYFKALARFLSDGLHRCGLHYCKGNIMATNKQWRQPLSVWKSQFSDWIDNHDPRALLNASIFFDLDGIFGETRFADELKHLIRTKAGDSPRFLTCLARNALLRRPPLGFFRQFVLEPDGAHKNTFNLKRRGTAPICDLARVHALACGSTKLNTENRLEDIKKTDLLAEGVGDDLLDALEFISMVRIRNQARQAERKEAPHNNVHPSTLSAFERRHLKDAFQIVARAQDFLKFRYNTGRGSSNSR